MSTGSSLFYKKKKMKKTDFINRVLLIMNEAGMTDLQGSSFLGADSAQVDRYIEGSYENAWRLLAATPALPKSWLTNKSFKNYPLIPDVSHGIGMVVLPSDFYLLTKFRMQGWQKHIDEASVGNERVSSIQSNPYTRGSIIRPTGVIDNMILPEHANINDEFNAVLSDNNTSTGFTGSAVYISKINEQILTISNLPSGTLIWRGEYDSDDGYSVDNVCYYNDNLWRANASTSMEPTPTAENWDLLESASYPDGSWLKMVIGEAVSYIYVLNYTRYDVPSDVTPGSISQVLKYYSLPTSYESHEVSEAIYVPNVAPLTDLDPDDEININQRIIEPLAYITAGAVFTIFQKDQLAASLTEKGLLMIPGYRSVKGTNITIKQ